MAGVINGCLFPKAVRAFLLVLRYVDLAFRPCPLFFFFFKKQCSHMKIHTYFLTVTCLTFRGVNPQPPRRWSLLPPTSGLASLQPPAPPGSDFFLGPFHFPLPSGGKRDWRNSYKRNCKSYLNTAIKKHTYTSTLINGLSHHYVNTLKWFLKIAHLLECFDSGVYCWVVVVNA